jgi:hypothetical protein
MWAINPIHIPFDPILNTLLHSNPLGKPLMHVVFQLVHAPGLASSDSIHPNELIPNVPAS